MGFSEIGHLRPFRFYGLFILSTVVNRDWADQDHRSPRVRFAPKATELLCRRESREGPIGHIAQLASTVTRKTTCSRPR